MNLFSRALISVASSNITTHCTHLYSCLVVEKNAVLAELVAHRFTGQPVLSSSTYTASSWRSVSCVFPSEGELIGAFYICLFLKLLRTSLSFQCVFLLTSLEVSQGLKNFEGDEKGTGRQMGRQCNRINFISVRNQGVWNSMVHELMKK